MAKLGSAATIFFAMAWFSGPNWKFSMRSCSSDSIFFASADEVVHSKRRPDDGSADRTAAHRLTTATAHTARISLIASSLPCPNVWVAPPPAGHVSKRLYATARASFRGAVHGSGRGLKRRDQGVGGGVG